MTDLTIRSQSNGVHPAIQDHYSEMNDVLHDRDNLREQVRQLENKLVVASQLNIEYKEYIARLTQERDYFYRKSTSFTHTLTNARNMIESIFALVDQDAENEAMKVPEGLKMTEMVANMASDGVINE